MVFLYVYLVIIFVADKWVSSRGSAYTVGSFIKYMKVRIAPEPCRPARFVRGYVGLSPIRNWNVESHRNAMETTKKTFDRQLLFVVSSSGLNSFWNNFPIKYPVHV